jgi:hypothetical protein
MSSNVRGSGRKAAGKAEREFASAQRCHASMLGSVKWRKRMPGSHRLMMGE